MNKEQENFERIKEVEKKVDILLCNHLPHIQLELEKTRTDLAWIIRFFWIIASASIGALIASLLSLIIR